MHNKENKCFFVYNSVMIRWKWIESEHLPDTVCIEGNHNSKKV